MMTKRQFFFGGSAAAIGGQIVRPLDRAGLLVAKGASALTSAGGRSLGDLGGEELAGFLRFGSGTTSAEGVFEEDRQLVARVNEAKASLDLLRARTTLKAAVKGLRIGEEVVFEPRDVVSIELITRTSLSTYESTFEIGDDTRIPDCVFTKKGQDPYVLEIEIDRGFFNDRYNSRLKLLAAASDPDFVAKEGRRLLLGRVDREKPVPVPTPRTFLSSYGPLYATIVKEMRWRGGRAFPDSRIEGNAVHVPDFGTVYFGELILLPDSRRLIGARFDLGCPWGAMFAVSEGADQPLWYP